jgi:phage regulator Rha-like protein
MKPAFLICKHKNVGTRLHMEPKPVPHVPKVLHQAVKRNIRRFPPDFMFQLNQREFSSLKSQFVTSKRGGIRRAFPYAFTEQGVAMLSSVLNSSRAVDVNIEIMRVFVRLRHALANNRALADKLAELEGRINSHDEQIQGIFEALRQLMLPPEPERKEIGFHVKEDAIPYRINRRIHRHQAT